MHTKEGTIAQPKLNAALSEISARLVGDPAYQRLVQQVDSVLGSKDGILPAAAQLGRLLVDAGLLDEADRLYRALAEQFPDAPPGFVGMAQVAVKRCHWGEALVRWQTVLARFSARQQAFWMASFATALIELGRFDEAEKVFRDLLRDFGDDSHGVVGLARLSMSRGLWVDALSFWDQAFDRFGKQAVPEWEASRAAVLSQLDRVDDAESIFHRLLDDSPTQPGGFVGLAQIAMRRRDWGSALNRWDDVIARFPDSTHPNWRLTRAHVLLELSRIGEAETAFRHILQRYPDSLNALLGLIRLLILTGKPDLALTELQSSPFGSGKIAAVVERKLEILTMLRRLDTARAEFQQTLSQTDDASILNVLFTHSAPLYSGWQRTDALLCLLNKIESLPPDSKSLHLPGLRARIFLALHDYDKFLSVVAQTKEHYLGEHWRGLLSVASKLNGPIFPDYQAPKIFGLGLSRTGTTSLAAALSALGFHTIHWLNPFTRDVMQPDDLHLFDAFTDTPVCLNFETYYFMFPNSKFIYTVRSFESWRKSMDKYYLIHHGVRNFDEAKAAMAQSGKLPYGVEFSNINLSLYFNHKNYEDAYNAYDQRVRTFFRDKPKDRFLESDVAAGGWDELCKFIGKERPSVPFPWLNQGSEKGEPKV